MSLKIGIVSDLHLEFGVNEQTISQVQHTLSDADLILMPGDICYGDASVHVAAMMFPDKPVFLVAGNHEFYGSDYARTLDDMQAASQNGNAKFLHRECATVFTNACAVRILGVTLWTDFSLHGNQPLALVEARQINDFRQITHGSRLLTPDDVLSWHEQEKAWLNDQLSTAFDGVTVVMTHHAPVEFAISPRYSGDRFSPCFASSLDALLLAQQPDLVVWGHTHYCVDRTIDGTRFVSSQVGYPRAGSSETGQYGRVVDVSAS